MTGTVQAVGLACGFLFLSLYQGVLGNYESLLFGSFLGITSGQVLALLAVAAVAILLLAVAGRPLLFASVDEGVARARGVPTRALGIGFLLLLGMAVAETAQITGALLVFALLVAPPATAQLLTARTGLGLALSVVLGVLVTWLGLGLAYFYEYPVGFYITTVAFVMYVLARAAAGGDRRSPLRLMFAQEFFRNALLAGQLRRAGLRARRLLRRAAGTGVRGRRAQSRRLHRRDRSGGGRPRHARRPVRGHDRGRADAGRDRPPRGQPKTWRSGSSSPGSSASACCSWRCSAAAPPAATGCSEHAPCSARSSD